MLQIFTLFSFQDGEIKHDSPVCFNANMFSFFFEGTKPNFPILPPPPPPPLPPFPPTYPPFEPYPPFQPFAPAMDPFPFHSQPWFDGYGLPPFEIPPYPGFDEVNHPIPPIPFPFPQWNQYQRPIPNTLTGKYLHFF